MFATTDEAFADLASTLAGIADGEWVPPLVVWVGGVEGVGLTTVQARLKSRGSDILRQWRDKRAAHLAAVKAAVVQGYKDGLNDKDIAARLGIEQSRVRYVRLTMPGSIGNRGFIDWAAKTSVIPRGLRKMLLWEFVGAVGTPYQTAYSALRQGRVPGWGLKDRLAVRMEVRK